MSSTPANKASNKSSKPSRKVILRLRSDLLARFPSEKPSKVPVSASSPSDTDLQSESNTPQPNLAGITQEGESAKKRGGAKPGIKRNASAANMDGLRPKGKPGPKKKPRLADGSIDRSQDTPRPAQVTTNAGPKLGPKANTGAINAGLRALDRSGKPCRRWDRKGLNLKSFTGIAWGLNSWRAPLRDTSSFSGEGKSDSSSTGDVKPTIDSSAVPSESSRVGDMSAMHNGIASSPAPIPV